MFLIHRHSIVQRWNPLNNSYDEILAMDAKEGDHLRGYNLFTLSFTRGKVVSKISLIARKIALRTSIKEPTFMTVDTCLASTSGVWTYSSSTKNVKLFKKTGVGGQLLTPKPSKCRFEENDVFVSLATGNPADTMLVDGFIYVTKDWNGLKIKTASSTDTPESVDEGQIPEPSEGER